MSADPQIMRSLDRIDNAVALLRTRFDPATAALAGNATDPFKRFSDGEVVAYVMSEMAGLLGIVQDAAGGES